MKIQETMTLMLQRYNLNKKNSNFKNENRDLAYNIRGVFIKKKKNNIKKTSKRKIRKKSSYKSK